MAKRKPWRCPSCGIEVGRVTTSFDGDHLHLYAELVLAVEPATPLLWLVRCRCGCVKVFDGIRVHMERRVAA